MNFDLSPDQAALQDAARELLADRCPPSRVRAVHDSGAGWDADLWARMVEQGWLATTVPETAGGLGMGIVELAVLLEQTGAHVAPVPFLPTAITIETARRAGADALVAELVAGARTACVVWSDRRDGVRVRGGVLSGRSDPVPFAPVADVALVVAPDDDLGAPGVFVADLAASGRPVAEPAMDLTRPLGWWETEGVPVERIGDTDLAEVVLDLAATATCCELLGASQTALGMAVEYAKDRVQFGRPIGSFQAVKHRCADMLVDVEGIRSSAYWAAWCLAVDDGDRAIAASTAKIWAGDASKRVMASALQVHGGIGFTWEHDLHLYLKRAQLDQVSFGDAVWHRARLGRSLRAKVDAGLSVL
ncbi:MAG: acyl-CoA dehydrogenase family protein [Acidimicrobiia bacterium]